MIIEARYRHIKKRSRWQMALDWCADRYTEFQAGIDVITSALIPSPVMAI